MIFSLVFFFSFVLLLESSHVDGAAIFPLVDFSVEAGTRVAADGWQDNEVGQVEFEHEILQVLSLAYACLIAFGRDVAYVLAHFEGAVYDGAVGERQVEREQVVCRVALGHELFAVGQSEAGYAC